MRLECGNRALWTGSFFFCSSLSRSLHSIGYWRSISLGNDRYYANDLHPFLWWYEYCRRRVPTLLYSCIKGTHCSRECCVPWENERNSTRCPGSSVVVADGVGFWPWNRPRSGILLGSAWRSWGKNGKMKWYVVNQHSNTLLSWRLCCRNDDYRWTWLLRWRKGIWSSNWKYVAYPERLQRCT